jgi:hypothetical protein
LRQQSSDRLTKLARSACDLGLGRADHAEAGQGRALISPAVAVELVLDRDEVEHVEDLGLVERPLHRPADDDLGEIEQRPRHRVSSDLGTSE